MRHSIEEWFSDSKAQIIKAVDEEGEILGWACWIAAEASESSSQDPDVRSKTESKPETKPEIAKEKLKQDPARVLGGLMYVEEIKYEKESLAGKNHMVLQALVTAPLHQNRGIGTQLVQWGVELADKDRVMCWAHASPSGHRLYESVGFEEVGSSDFELSEYAPGGRDGRRGWVSEFCNM